MQRSLGVVEEHRYSIAEPMPLDSGVEFGPLTVVYETYGTLNDDATNAVLVLHAFSGDAHAAGKHSVDDSKAGWWDAMIGPGKAIDTEKYFVICSNVLGGCMGTTGPSSVNPETREAYGLNFPVITIHDMVKVQRRLIDHLGVGVLHAVIGGSMGGMQALEWVAGFPERVHSAIILASTSRLTAQGIAFNYVGRNAIMSDPAWKRGTYAAGEAPYHGLAIARMVGHITYLSEESMGLKFGRRLQSRKKYGFDFDDQFQVESYLAHQGDKFVERFDANSYIYLSKAMDYFDMTEKYGTLENAFVNTTARFLVVSYSSDWLYPSAQSKEIVRALMRAGRDVSYTEISSPYGHDAFLLETDRQAAIISAFLENSHDK